MAKYDSKYWERTLTVTNFSQKYITLPCLVIAFVMTAYNITTPNEASMWMLIFIVNIVIYFSNSGRIESITKKLVKMKKREQLQKVNDLYGRD